MHAYLCSECGENFANAYQLRRHSLRIHENIVCQKGLLSDDQKGYCKYCGLRFLDKTKLIMHVKEHTLVLKCKICAKRFASEISLENHEKTHKEGDYSFQCTNCDSRYASKSQLKRHFDKIHVDQQWLCTICHKSLSSARALDVHEKLHEGIKEYKCFLCKKQFSQTRRLREHLIANHTKSRFCCTACDVRCISQRGFEAHLRKDHPGMFEAQPNMKLYFVTDEPNHTNIMQEYQKWLQKLTKERQEANKLRENIGVEVIEVEYPNEFDEEIKIEEEEVVGSVVE